jgi:hypothetical protein
MFCANRLKSTNLILVAAVMSAFAVAARGSAQDEKDSHRPPCTSVYCKKVKFFLKRHYCGESPAGNGPDDGCDLRDQKKPGAGVSIKAETKCEWNTSKGEAECVQRGEPSPDVRSILMDQLRKLGLPAKANGKTYFTVWESTQEGWFVVEADYSNPVGADVELCQVIVLIDKNSQVAVLRKVPFQKTDSDVPTVTQWSLLDLADVDGSGQVEIILQGDAYENHWLEVVGMRNGSPKTIFSGLGYYL